MMKTITLALLTALLVITGCASTNELYYESVQKTAEANARAVQAKFDALSKIASSGDGQAASAAVMALALTSTPNAQPIPQKSEAIQWASILASPVTSLGMMWMQADSAKTMARYNSQVDLAQVAADAQTQQALYGSFSDISSAGFTAVGNVDYTPFIDGMVNLGTTGMDNLTTLGTAGFDANVTLGTAGITGVVDMGTAGVNGVVDVANVGINGVVDLGTTGYNTILTMDQGNNALTSSVWADYTTSIEQIMTNIPKILCSVTSDGAGGTTVTCE
jgi:hypothetical protein